MASREFWKWVLLTYLCFLIVLSIAIVAFPCCYIGEFSPCCPPTQLPILLPCCGAMLVSAFHLHRAWRDDRSASGAQAAKTR
jgi:hypothetical protein